MKTTETNTKFEQLLQKLNPQQRKAVEHLEGPMLVVAGPGTGKTQVLAMRIAFILQNTDYTPENILCLTFTESGVKAMRNRLLQIIGTTAYYLNIYTFHGFANDVINTFPEKFPDLGSNPKQLDDLTKLKTMREVITEVSEAKIAHEQGEEVQLNLNSQSNHLINFHNKFQHLKPIQAAITNLKREGVSTEAFLQAAKQELQELQAAPELNNKQQPTQKYQTKIKFAEKNIELADMYRIYQEKLANNNFYDYEDMIMKVIARMQGDEELLLHYQEKFQHILVDEYQDTNGAQNILTKLLASYDEQPNLFAVGDDDQAIYRFQGANVDNLLYFTEQFANVAMVTITTNYRSSQAILDAAQDSVSHNQNRLVNLIDTLDKNLTAALDLPNYKPQVVELPTQQQENDYLVQEIGNLIKSGANYQDIAILYRRHSDAEDIIETFLKAGIPIQLHAGSNALDERPVRRLLNILKVIHYEADERDRLLSEILFYDFLQQQFNISRLDAFQKLTAYKDKHKYNKKKEKIPYLWQELFGETKDGQLQLDTDETGLPALATKLLDWKQNAHELNISEFVVTVLHESGLLKNLLKEKEDIEAINAVNSFINYIKQLNRKHKDLTLAELLDDLALLEENGLEVQEQQLETDTDAVNLMTAHAAKGLEYKYVFIAKCYHKNWGGRTPRDIIKLPSLAPTAQDLETEKGTDLEEEDERRLFFVAVTRAQERIYLTYARRYESGDATKETEPSQFLTEINSQLLEATTAGSEEFDVATIARNLTPIVQDKLHIQEQEFLKSLVKDFRLSPSSLNTYLRDPLEFLFTHLLKVPQPARRPMLLGSSVHKGLEKYMRKLMNNEEPDLDYMLKEFDNNLQQELIDTQTYEEVLSEGKEILTNYYKHYQQTFTPPAEVELYLNNAILEVPEQEPMQLTGKLDKVEWLDETASTVKVVDYKTSSPKSENEIRGNTKYSDGEVWRQLVFYKLLGDNDPYFKPKNKMNKYLIKEAEVDFLRPQDDKYKKVTVEIAAEDVEELKQTTRTVVRNIRELNFFSSQDFPVPKDSEYLEFFNQISN